jgi:hypothetical protein
MNINQHQQRGMTAMAVISFLVILIFVLIIFFKLFPLYMESWQVASALGELAEEQKLLQKTDRNIEREFLGYLNEKDIELFDKKTIGPALTIDRRSEEGVVEVTVQYHRVKPLMGNVSFRVDFEKKIQAP